MFLAVGLYPVILIKSSLWMDLKKERAFTLSMMPVSHVLYGPRALLVFAGKRDLFPSRSIHSEHFFPSSSVYCCLPGQLFRQRLFTVFICPVLLILFRSSHVKTKLFVLNVCWSVSSFVQMHFSLYLSGDFNGSLLVTVVENGTSTTILVWEKHDQWTNNWEDVVLQLSELHHE